MIFFQPCLYRIPGIQIMYFYRSLAAVLCSLTKSNFSFSNLPYFYAYLSLSFLTSFFTFINTCLLKNTHSDPSLISHSLSYSSFLRAVFVLHSYFRILGGPFPLLSYLKHNDDKFTCGSGEYHPHGIFIDDSENDKSGIASFSDQCRFYSYIYAACVTVSSKKSLVILYNIRSCYLHQNKYTSFYFWSLQQLLSIHIHACDLVHVPHLSILVVISTKLHRITVLYALVAIFISALQIPLFAIFFSRSHIYFSSSFGHLIPLVLCTT